MAILRKEEDIKARSVELDSIDKGITKNVRNVVISFYQRYFKDELLHLKPYFGESGAFSLYKK